MIRAPFPLGPRTTTPLPQPPRDVVTLPCGDELAYAVQGPTDGPVLVAVHGFRGSDMGLQAVLAGLDGWRILSPNAPGMGVSPVQPGIRYDFPRLVTDVVEFLEWHARPVVLLGHSFGTTVVSAAAAERPDLVSRLVLVSPIVEPVRGSGVNAVATDVLTAFFAGVAKLPPRVGTRVIDSKFPGEQSLPFMRRRPGSWGRVQELSHEELPQSFDRDAVLRAHVASTSRGCAEVATRLSMPVDVIVGTRDQFATMAMVRRFATACGARVHPVDGAGHLMHYEDVEAVHAALRDVLASTD